MKGNMKVWALAAACAGAALPATAQDVYRCGDSYSQRPCPGGTVVPTDDARSASQRSEAREAAQRTGKMADAMEQARLKEEAKAAVYLAPPRSEPEPQREEKKIGLTKPKKPAYFTAHSPRKPGDPAPKKKSKKKASE
jgi:hypothetical protein